MATSFNTYTVEDIESQGGLFNGSTLSFEHKIFRRSLRCRKTMHNAIQDYCRIAKQNGHHFVLVEEEEFISMWRQTEDRKSERSETSSSVTRVQVVEKTKVQRTVQNSTVQTSSLLTQELIDTCQKALLIAVGPIANLVLKEIQVRSGNMAPIEFINALGNRLPNEDLKVKFLKELLSKDLEPELSELIKTLLSQ